MCERRRKHRQCAEQRTATDEERAEFEQHFLMHKVALGDYGTPCVHEHACFSDLNDQVDRCVAPMCAAGSE
jgi:hypothetical protein